MLHNIKFRILTEEASEKFVFTMKARQEFPLDKFFRPILSDSEKPMFRLLVNGETFVKALLPACKKNDLIMTEKFSVLKPGDFITTPTHRIEIQECPVAEPKPVVTVLNYKKRFSLTASHSQWLAVFAACLFLLSHHQWQTTNVLRYTNGGRDPSSVDLPKHARQVFLAIQMNNVEKLQRLVRDDANAKMARDAKGKTPLMEAASLGRSEIVQVLGALGADLNAKDNEGNTALMLAVASNQLKAVNSLLALGADIAVKRGDQLDALTMAERLQQNEIVAAILSAKNHTK